MLQKKVCMLGSFSVGKSSLVRRFVESMFDEQYHTTIGVKVDKKVVNANGQDLTLVLWDIYGEDVFQKMRMSYLRGMHGYLLVVDGTRRKTLDDALALNDRVVSEIGKVPAVLALNNSTSLINGKLSRGAKRNWPQPAGRSSTPARRPATRSRKLFCIWRKRCWPNKCPRIPSSNPSSPARDTHYLNILAMAISA
jgi:small GTP-binding protein